ncbi:hypothetical protein NKG94_17050 [Micromonospora sp. M12]
MPPTGIGLHIWVLRLPDLGQPQAGALLVVDATTAPTTGAIADVAGTAWRAYLSDHYADEPGVHRAVPAIEVLDDQVDLTPQRYLPRSDELATNPSQIIAKISDFESLLEQVRRSLPAVQEVETAALRLAPRLTSPIWSGRAACPYSVR